MPTPSAAERHAAERSRIARAVEREKRQPVSDPMPFDEARKLTDSIRRDAGTLEEMIQRAYLGRAWSALGYESWNAYCDTEFASVRLRLPRQKSVCALRELGLSVRAIAAATGISDQTVQRDIASGVVNHYTSLDDEVIDAEVVPEPQPVTGVGRQDLPTAQADDKRKKRPKFEESIQMVAAGQAV